MEGRRAGSIGSGGSKNSGHLQESATYRIAAGAGSVNNTFAPVPLSQHEMSSNFGYQKPAAFHGTSGLDMIISSMTQDEWAAVHAQLNSEQLR